MTAQPIYAEERKVVDAFLRIYDKLDGLDQRMATKEDLAAMSARLRSEMAAQGEQLRTELRSEMVAQGE